MKREKGKEMWRLREKKDKWIQFRIGENFIKRSTVYIYYK